MRNNKRIAIYLGHPAHFHLFKNAAKNLIDKGYDITFTVKRKDVLEQLVKNAGFKYVVIRDEPRKKTDKLSLIWSITKMDWKGMKFLWKYKPDLYIGTYGFWSSLIYGCPFICCNEDDAAVVPHFAYLAYPTASALLTPVVCNNGHWDTKSLKYPGYHELAYLHPNHFTPDPKIVEAYGIDTSKPYFVMRFASLNAHHDSGIKGINTEIAERLVKILEPHGTIYITSERPLEPQFEKYRIKINPLDMHHVMAFASLYIGDSQTMAAEAGVLGVPFVRFNDFVGRIGYLRELEDKYELGYGIHASVLPADSPIRRNDGSVQPSGVEELYKRVEELVAMPSEQRRKVWAERRTQMLSDKVDCAKFLTYFIEQYPSSASEVKNATPDFWDRFK
jgi:hypothetical protein